MSKTSRLIFLTTSLITLVFSQISYVAATPTKQSIVVLGDSVAAGEGINYGYSYDVNSVFGARWVGGVDNPAWQGQYQLCHDSKQAYGDIIAGELNADLAKFACTGATYDNGLIGKREYNGTLFRPAEFGNWSTQKQLNPDYDKAMPDTVILTFGADDVRFVDIMTFCATGFTSADTETVNSLTESERTTTAIREHFLNQYPDPESFAKAQASMKKTKQEEAGFFNYCTAANPGKPIEEYFWKPINNGTLAQHYVDMVNAIKARGKKAGKVPNIIFTTYHHPLPKAGESIDCHDVLDLDRDEINYINSLETTLNNTIKNALQGLPGVAVADLSTVMDGHRWCSDDPWTYGLSILWLNRLSQAPFHPTPAGQKAIADIVKGLIK